MELSVGTRIGRYEILASLGEGSTGKVYRARDTEGGCDVALKVFVQDPANGSERHRRLERVVQAAIRLEHPRIRALYDLERRKGVEFLVMEYLEGKTLAARLEKGPLPIDEALRIAIQMAEALGAAHGQGSIHGDLKPANVLLTGDGVKLLDFGQAGVREPVRLAGELPDSATSEGAPFAAALAYMAPEQIEGKEPDARSDIFSFGAVLYEMAGGRRAFRGTSPPAVVADVLGSEPPPIASLRPATPPALDRLVRTCLAKNPTERPQSAHDLEGELKWIRDRISKAGEETSDHEQRRSLEHLAWWTAIGALILAVGMIVAYLLRPAAHGPAPRLQAIIKLPANFHVDTRGASIVFSAGGRRVVVVGSQGNEQRRLWLRAAEGAVWKPLAGTDGASYPFWSPDGRSIGFFADRMLKRIDLDNGAVLTICGASNGRGGSWNQQGTIVFAPVPSGGLYRVPAAGGTPIQVSVPASAAISHRLPQFLPDGRHVLFLAKVFGPSERNGIYVLDIETGQVLFLLRGESEGRYVKPGYLAFLRGDDLMVQRFSAARMQLRGRALRVAEGVRGTEGGAGEFSFSSTESLLYQSDDQHQEKQLTWFSREGKELSTVGEPQEFASVAISPEGHWVAVRIPDASGNEPIWICRLADDTRHRLTPTKGSFGDPVWSPGGSRLAYDDRGTNLYVQAVSGKLPAEKLWSGHEARPTDWSPDGRLLAVDVAGDNGLDVWLVPLKGVRKPYPMLATPFNETGGTFSADGRWLAYLSDETGENQLYVIPLRGRGRARQVSITGAVTGGWLPGQAELAYETPAGRLFVVDARTRGRTLRLGQPRLLLGGRRLEANVKIGGLRCFSPDAKRLLLPVPVLSETESGTLLTLVTNWLPGFEEK